MKIKVAYTLWDIAEFAVPVFVFCSAYLFFSRPPHIDRKNIFSYFRKRVLRLVIPYYAFLLVNLALIYIAEPKKLTSQFITNNFLIIGGVDYNWLVLLFLQFAFLFPLVLFLRSIHKILWYLVLAATTISSVVFLFYQPVAYKWIMWLPWLMIAMFTFYFIRYEKKPWFIPAVGIVSFAIYFALRIWLHSIGHHIDHYHNKYPPNLLHLSYGIGWICLLYGMFKLNLERFIPFKQTLEFLSKNSYTIFFIHFLFIYFFTAVVWIDHRTWKNFFLIVFFSSIGAQLLLNQIQASLPNLKKSISADRS
jgi:peptidoglycan/LPS O-acetylase OafA/YrhL